MGSAHHPHRDLILRSIDATIENARRNGGVVAALEEARRLAATYPDAALTEAEILAEFRNLAALRAVPIESGGEYERPPPASREVDAAGLQPAMPVSDQDQVRQQIWERIHDRVAACLGDPVVIDARQLAGELLAEFPGSGIDEGQIALEFHRIRRAFRERRS
jgi:hypothetical protein